MRTIAGIIVATLVLLSGGFHAAALAQHGGTGSHGGMGHSHGGFHGGHHHGFHGGGGVIPAPAFGFGNGGWWPYDFYGYSYPYYSGAVAFHRPDYGTLEFKVKPGDTQVFVDNRYMGRINDIYKHRVYIPGGYHRIRLIAPNGAESVSKVLVAAGKKSKVEQKL